MAFAADDGDGCFDGEYDTKIYNCYTFVKVSRKDALFLVIV